jgi:hypothetical protein
MIVLSYKLDKDVYYKVKFDCIKGSDAIITIIAAMIAYSGHSAIFFSGILFQGLCQEQ